jgi:hypothetical protein
MSDVQVFRVVNRVWQRAWGSSAPDHITRMCEGRAVFLCFTARLFQQNGFFNRMAFSTEWLF